ncbi:acyltransferase 3 [Mycolicibacterium chitae]|uniref:Acyltransferase 3 n=1 Tax=Mycolicibacterium chitae TaxID=1792 RepID=A0A448I2V8_MYCCI|nr:acyltransferase 3 [Mycolicibacterium chitae]
MLGTGRISVPAHDGTDYTLRSSIQIVATLDAVLAGPSRSARTSNPAGAPRRAPQRLSAHLDALTGLRAVAALLVVATHAAFATGGLTDTFLGNVYARLEVGVPIFFALSGFLLFRPWVRHALDERAEQPRLRRYTRSRVRRILPAYVVTVLAVFAVYTVFTPGPNPGQSWSGLLRYLTLTQIYTDDFLITLLHPGLSQMWSLAVEVSFYAVLPALAYLLLTVLCGGRWRPGLLLAGLGALAAVGPLWLIAHYGGDWLPNSAGMWLPAHLAPFAGGMMLAVLHAMGVRVRAATTLPLAVLAFLLVSTPIAGGTALTEQQLSQPLAKAVLYAAVALLLLAPLVLGDRGWFTRVLSSRPLVWLGEISYEIFLVHVAVMAIAMHLVLDWPLFTGSMLGLMLTTLALSVPLSWLLRRLTQARARSAGTSSVSARPRCDAASFSAGLSSAADREDPSGMKIGS